LKETQIVVEP
jgi:NADPH-dependent curcumin reductase CurA